MFRFERSKLDLLVEILTFDYSALISFEYKVKKIKS